MSESLALLTDLYQLTMAYGYWRLGRADDEAVFHLFFRRPPFGGNHAVAAGLAHAVAYLQALQFADDDLAYLAELTGNDGLPLFPAEFLAYLGELRFSCEVDAVPEGTVMFAHEPLLRVRGPVLQCQLVETPLLNIINFSTLIATKAARVCQAARGQSVLEFGLRRAQGIDGALSAARAAYIGGCAATSNVLAGKRYGIPVRGTHAHSWVMSFADEPAAFAAYADALPNNCVFLVDTYDTLAGVAHAIAAGEALRARGHKLAGIRLDSGDLADLSQKARALLDAAGFHDAVIVASNDLDEHEISRLRGEGAQITVWGVGTRLITGGDQPALGGVYKLAAIRPSSAAPWQYCVKLSEDPIKVSNPGIQQVRRFVGADGRFVGDVIYDDDRGCSGVACGLDAAATKSVPTGEGHDLLVPVWRAGQAVYTAPSLAATQAYAQAQLASLGAVAGDYPVGLDAELHALKAKLIADARKSSA